MFYFTDIFWFMVLLKAILFVKSKPIKMLLDGQQAADRPGQYVRIMAGIWWCDRWSIHWSVRHTRHIIPAALSDWTEYLHWISHDGPCVQNTSQFAVPIQSFPQSNNSLGPLLPSFLSKHLNV